MRVLTVGAGVIGTVYGAHLAAAGHLVSVLKHPPRTDQAAHSRGARQTAKNTAELRLGDQPHWIVLPGPATGRGGALSGSWQENRMPPGLVWMSMRAPA
jgi:3-hydroxyisobutyrate dehydrogenase-like beta-hydroxyacid dehydrogenase